MDTPLTPLSMAVLVALARQDLHGYALMSEVSEQLGKRPGTGSLYAALDRMQEEGLVIESPEGPGPKEDQRRKYFRITAAGRARARAEAERLLRVLDAAKEALPIGSLSELRGEAR